MQLAKVSKLGKFVWFPWINERDAFTSVGGKAFFWERKFSKTIVCRVKSRNLLNICRRIVQEILGKNTSLKNGRLFAKTFLRAKALIKEMVSLWYAEEISQFHEIGWYWKIWVRSWEKYSSKFVGITPVFWRATANLLKFTS